ncbi:UNVERIFIED_CONTAM: hypothetical protein FKN15_068694 [Acipenser sinensis]
MSDPVRHHRKNAKVQHPREGNPSIQRLRGGSPQVQSPQGGSPNVQHPRGGSPSVECPAPTRGEPERRASSAHEGGARASSAHEGGTRTSSAHEGGARASSAHEGGARASSAHEGGAHVSSAHEGGARASSAHEGGARASSAHEGGARASSAHEGGARASRISVSVSTFSLVAIAIERYSAICNPLKSRAWQTRSHAYRVIASTWILSLIIMIPYPVFSTLMAFPKANNSTGHNCRLMWPKDQVQQAWTGSDRRRSGTGSDPRQSRTVVETEAAPAALLLAVEMVEAEAAGILLVGGGAHRNGLNVMGNPATSSDEGDGCYIQVTKCQNMVEMSTLNPSGGTKMDRARSNTSEAKLMAKKRVVRMLIVIVAMFFVCWMPIYSVNTWRAFDHHTAHKVLSGAPISFIHLMSYTSACVNPIIYCFMNKRFRKTFLATFACCWRPCCHFQETKDEVAGTVASLSKFSYTTVSTLGPS